jgi:hypothetical protein
MISLITALEIFTQPNDLCLTVFQPKGEEKWGVIIGRGIGHSYKLMVSNGLDQAPHFENRQAAIDGIIQVLNIAIEAASKETTDPTSIASIVNPGGLQQDEMWTSLKAGDVEEIKERFVTDNVVDTSKVPLKRFSETATSTTT